MTAYGRVLNYALSDPDDVSGKPFKVSIYKHCFQGAGRIEDVAFKARAGTHQFDYGYTITCHKAQGSQWDDVVVFDESRAFLEDASKWLYTAVTRAASNLTLVVRTMVKTCATFKQASRPGRQGGWPGNCPYGNSTGRENHSRPSCGIG